MWCAVARHIEKDRCHDRRAARVGSPFARCCAYHFCASRERPFHEETCAARDRCLVHRITGCLYADPAFRPYHLDSIVLFSGMTYAQQSTWTTFERVTMFTWDSLSDTARGSTRQVGSPRHSESPLSGFVVSVDRLFYTAAAAFVISLVLLAFG